MSRPREDDDLTIAPGVATTPPAPSTSRFVPGAVVAGRYRLVALLGHGGMGDVYRADDLTLDQPVALKFLAEGVADDASQLAQFHNELRVARQVSHKNVCRLYDLGEAEGRRFLTMEYVDGEDLASLLRRIGRLPPDKAVETARQLCAGLAAAHERGVLHRDLKPANVMLDGDGNVRITDFGLAAVQGDRSAVNAGTPQYMAPEQLAGQPASVKTDIYALGLVLFEIFTGKRTHDAKTLNELIQLHQSRTVTTPSSVVRDIDPATERIILRCLEHEPERRPASALAVAAALPGGDPLAAALAAGETPSPEMLAAAGETEALPVSRGMAAVAVVLTGLAVCAVVSPRATVARLVPLDRPPMVLADRAEQMLVSFGYGEPRVDSAFSFSVRNDYLNWIARTDTSSHRWDVLATGSPPALTFWYRIVGPWTRPTRMINVVQSPIDRVLNDIFRVMMVVLLVVAIVFARRHSLSGRADFRGAMRVAVFTFVAQIMARLVGGHHVANISLEYQSLVRALEEATLIAGVLWVVYVALEPYGRRFWPDMLLGWSRLLSGRIKDPRVGRDVLAGIVFGIAFILIETGRTLLPGVLGYRAGSLRLGRQVDTLLGGVAIFQIFSKLMFEELLLALLTVLVFVMCRLLTRRTAVAVALGMFVMFYAWMAIGSGPAFWLELCLELAAITVLAVVTIRFGLLATAVALFVAALCEQVPLTLTVSHWSATASNCALASVLLLTAFGFYASRAGQPLFGTLDPRT